MFRRAAITKPKSLMGKNPLHSGLAVLRLLRHFVLVSSEALLVLGASLAGATDSDASPKGLRGPGPSWENISYVCASNNKEPIYQGLPISLWLQKNTLLNTNRLTLSELLTLKQVSAPDDWGIVQFELAIPYDVMTNSSRMHLGRLNPDGQLIPCCYEECERATNGHCLLSWNINYDRPGKHNIRAQLVYGGPGPNRLTFDSITVVGPALTFYSSNACMFFEGATLFNSAGARLFAKLRQQAATYRIELNTVNGKHLKTFTGSTTNGMISLDWDLHGEHGKEFKGASFDAFFHVTYPGEKTPGPPARDRFNRVPDSFQHL